MDDQKTLAARLLHICELASAAILEIYQNADLQIQKKADNSPVTQADMAAHEIIKSALLELTPDIPQLSEEDASVAFSQRKLWPKFWCIDPLDGTKEFIHRNDEFTINIALIENHRPVLGIVYVPVTGTAYWGGTQVGAWKQCKGAAPVHIRSRPLGEKLVITASRRHGQEKNDKLLQPLSRHFRQISNKGVGSSLKMCLIAEGLADFYPRLFPTSEWDTAAGQAVVEAAGGRFVNASNLEPLTYNQKESLENPFFYVCGDPQFPLEEIARRR